MAFPWFFCIIVILLISTTSVRMYSVSYEGHHLAISNTPKLMYSDSESNPIFSGYSYATQDLNGGESNVIFTTGVDSLSTLRHEMNSMRLSERETQKNLMPSEQQRSKFEESMSEREDFNSNVEDFKEKKELSKSFETENNFVEHQVPFQQVSFLPYSAFGTNLLNFPTVLPRYYLSPNTIQSYYSHNPYSQLNSLPLHNFNFYDPSVPLFYRTAITIPNNNTEYIVAQDTKISLESNDIKSSQTKATVSESSVIESRSGLESAVNVVDEMSNKSDMFLDKLMTTSKKVEEEITSTVPSKNSVEQIMEDRTNTTELANTEINLSMEKSTIATSKRFT